MNDGIPQTDDPAVVRAELEGAIRAIWMETLELTDVSVDNDFFDLGGHSLIAIEVIEKIRALLRAPKLPIDLIETPTITTLTDDLLERLGVGAAA